MTPFSPTRLLPAGHAMTVAAALVDPWRRIALPPAERRQIRVDAETRVEALVDDAGPGAPTVVLLHGLTGHAGAGYMRSTAKKLLARGFTAVRLNARNCGGTEHLTPTLYHSGLTDDLSAVLDAVGPSYVVGFSKGGNIALEMAGELGDAGPARIRGVAVMSPPIELWAAERAIDTGAVNGIYQRWFLRALKALIRRKARLFPGRYPVAGLRRIRTLRAFDDRYVAPAFGFSDALDYYQRASAGPWLDRIRVPVFVLTARDDSIVPVEGFERWRRRGAPEVELLVTEQGGHTGFIARGGAVRGDPDRFWGENRLVDWVTRRAERAP